MMLWLVNGSMFLGGAKGLLCFENAIRANAGAPEMHAEPEQ